MQRRSEVNFEYGELFRELSRVSRVSILTFVVWSFVAVGPVLAQRRIGQDPGWETLEPCRLLQAWGNDGDSFHVEHQGREYIFRLYFVDTPERGTNYPDRVKRQAQYFGITEQASVELGKEAAKFTDDFLKQEFAVLTRWENARGNGDLPRFFGAVIVGTNDLARVLVQEGYACRIGAPADYPGGLVADDYRHLLHDLEVKSKKTGHGVWSDRWPTVPFPAPTESTNEISIVELNTAKPAALKRVPGIGPELADSIVRNRPYQQVDDLLRVSAIRPARLELIRPYVKVEPLPAPEPKPANAPL